MLCPLTLQGTQNKTLSAMRTQGSNGEPLTDEQKVKKREERARVRSLEGDPTKILTINEKDWEKMTQASVVSTVTKAFDKASVSEDDTESVHSERSSAKRQDFNIPKIDDAALESLSSGDAQHLANVLQQQLDAINKELA